MKKTIVRITQKEREKMLIEFFYEDGFSSNWMYLDPENIVEELQERANKYSDVSNGGEYNKNFYCYTKQDIKVYKKLLQQFKLKLAGKECFQDNKSYKFIVKEDIA